MAETGLAPAPARMAPADRRTAILDETIRIIGEQGYRAFSINTLAKRCGLSTPGLLHHFGSKEGVLVALLEERDRRDKEALAGQLGKWRGEALTRDQILQVLHAIVAHNAGQPQMMRLFTVLRAEALSSDHPAQSYFLEREKRVQAMLRDIVAPVAGDAAATAMQVQAMMHGMEAQWLRSDCSFDLVGTWDAAVARLT